MNIAIELRALKIWEEYLGRLLAIDIHNRQLLFDTVIIQLNGEAVHCIPDLNEHIGKRVSLLRTDSIKQPYRLTPHDDGETHINVTNRGNRNK